jgi:Uma2 family endonuclease
MADPARRKATYSDLEKVPPHLVAEIIDGALVTHPRPMPRHAVAAASLGDELLSPFQKGRDGPGGWIFMVEPELHFGLDVVVPDIAGWRRENLPKLPETAFIDVAPDWTCEVLSPSTEFFDRGAKRDIYARAGISYLWLINSTSQQLEASQLVVGHWMLQATIVGASDVRIPPFDAISFSLAALWPYDEPIDPNSPPTQP